MSHWCRLRIVARRALHTLPTWSETIMCFADLKRPLGIQGWSIRVCMKKAATMIRRSDLNSCAVQSLFFPFLYTFFPSLSVCTIRTAIGSFDTVSWRLVPYLSRYRGVTIASSPSDHVTNLSRQVSYDVYAHLAYGLSRINIIRTPLYNSYPTLFQPLPPDFALHECPTHFLTPRYYSIGFLRNAQCDS